MGPRVREDDKSLILRFFRFAENNLTPPANHRKMIRVSSHQEGRLAIATNAGRDAVDAEVPITNGTIAYGEVVWS